MKWVTIAVRLSPHVEGAFAVRVLGIYDSELEAMKAYVPEEGWSLSIHSVNPTA